MNAKHLIYLLRKIGIWAFVLAMLFTIMVPPMMRASAASESIIVAVRGDTQLYRLYFNEIDGSGFKAVLLANLDGFGATKPAISPDGQWVAAVRCAFPKDFVFPCDAYKVSLSGGQYERLTFSGRVEEVAWLNNDLYIQEEGVIKGLKTGMLYSGTHISASPDGRMIASNVEVDCIDRVACPNYNYITFNKPTLVTAWQPNGRSVYVETTDALSGNNMLSILHLDTMTGDPVGVIGTFVAPRPNDFSDYPDMLMVATNGDLVYLKPDEGDGEFYKTLAPATEGYIYPVWAMPHSWRTPNSAYAIWPYLIPEYQLLPEQPDREEYEVVVGIRDGVPTRIVSDLGYEPYRYTPLIGLDGFGKYNPIVSEDGKTIYAYRVYDNRWYAIASMGGSWTYATSAPAPELLHSSTKAILPWWAVGGCESISLIASDEGLLMYFDYPRSAPTDIYDPDGNWTLVTWWGLGYKMYWELDELKH